MSHHFKTVSGVENEYANALSFLTTTIAHTFKATRGYYAEKRHQNPPVTSGEEKFQNV